MKAKRGSLRWKLVAWSFIPTALVLSLVAVVNFQAYNRVTQDLVVQRNRELARLLASRAGEELGVFSDALESAALDLGSLGSNSLPSQEAARQARLRFQNYREPGELAAVFDAGLVLLDRDGRVVAALPPRAVPASGGDLRADWSDTAITRQIVSRWPSSAFISDLTPLGSAGQEAVALAAPVPGLSQYWLVGLFWIGPGRSNNFYDAIARLRLETRGAAYLVDGNGRVIYHSQGERIGEDFSARPIVRQVLAGKVGSLRSSDEGKDVVASYAPVLGTRWGLVTQESWAALAAGSLAYNRFLLLLLACGLLAPAVVVTLGVGRITRPIHDLTLAAQEVAGGRFYRTIQARSGDELEALAEQFNRMSEQLRESYANLEGRVADRTRELATLNAITSVASRSLDLEEILLSALGETLRAMEMEAGAVYLLDERGEAVLQVQSGLSAGFLSSVKRLAPGLGAAGEAARRGEPVVWPAGAYPPGDLRAAVEREGLEWIVSLPLLSKGRMLGAMNLCTRRAQRDFRQLKPEELEMLASIGNQVGVAVENARLYAQAEQSAVAAERSRLARDLHDAVTQTLFSASLIADVLPRLWDRNPEEARRRTEELRRLNRGALAEMRTLLLELRPSALLEGELPELLRHLADAFTGRTQVPVSLSITGVGAGGAGLGLPPEVKLAFYRLAQEALNNIAKHAWAGQVSLAVEAGGATQVRLRVEDDGCGFDPAAVSTDHLGLSIMKERAESIGASLSVESAAGRGTRILVIWQALESEDQG